MFELEQNHRCGRKTFVFLFVRYGWWLSIIGFGLIYLSWLCYFGRFRNWTEEFLRGHADWYVSVGMLSEWVLMAGISFILVAYLRAFAIYRSYKFMLDEHAFHMRKGLLFVQETTIPYQQISQVNISRPYHYRIFGVAELDILASDTRSDPNSKASRSKFLIPVVDAFRAKALSKQLMQYASMTRHGQVITGMEEVEEEESEEA